jgi:hypothetical protein
MRGELDYGIHYLLYSIYLHISKGILVQQSLGAFNMLADGTSFGICCILSEYLIEITAKIQVKLPRLMVAKFLVEC